MCAIHVPLSIVMLLVNGQADACAPANRCCRSWSGSGHGLAQQNSMGPHDQFGLVNLCDLVTVPAVMVIILPTKSPLGAEGADRNDDFVLYCSMGLAGEEYFKSHTRYRCASMVPTNTDEHIKQRENFVFGVCPNPAHLTVLAPVHCIIEYPYCPMFRASLLACCTTVRGETTLLGYRFAWCQILIGHLAGCKAAAPVVWCPKLTNVAFCQPLEHAFLAIFSVS